MDVQIRVSDEEDPPHLSPVLTCRLVQQAATDGVRYEARIASGTQHLSAVSSKQNGRVDVSGQLAYLTAIASEVGRVENASRFAFPCRHRSISHGRPPGCSVAACCSPRRHVDRGGCHPDTSIDRRRGHGFLTSIETVSDRGSPRASSSDDDGLRASYDLHPNHHRHRSRSIDHEAAAFPKAHEPLVVLPDAIPFRRV